MTPSETRKYLLRALRTDAQRSGQAQNAMDLIESGLDSLLRIGFAFNLSIGSGYVPQGWPKMMYSRVHGERIVHSADELVALPGPWSEEPFQEYIPK